MREASAVEMGAEEMRRLGGGASRDILGVWVWSSGRCGCDGEEVAMVDLGSSNFFSARARRAPMGDADLR
jgi:hypothetical protein